MTHTLLTRHQHALAAFCQRWQVTELAVFGSVLRPDFHTESDIDVLVTFAPTTRWSLLDLERMEEELTTLLGRRVDLVSRRGLEQSRNWIMRQAILDQAEVIYHA
jgi:predicted nucleotidyltransferase